MKKLLAIVVLGLMWNVNSNAKYGALGVVQCGDVIKIDRENNSTGRFQVSDWMMGYITGRSYPDKDTGDINQDALFYEVLNYCKENPLHSTPQAAEIIYFKLKKK